jgi:hypothetical protein
MQNKVKASFSTSRQCSERIVNPFGGHIVTHNILWHIIRHKHHTNVDSTWPKFKSVQVAYLHIDLNNISGSASYILHDDMTMTHRQNTRAHPSWGCSKRLSDATCSNERAAVSKKKYERAATWSSTHFDNTVMTKSGIAQLGKKRI